MSTILLIVLVLLVVGALPTRPYSSGWGYHPSGGLGLVVVIVLILVLMARVWRDRQRGNVGLSIGNPKGLFSYCSYAKQATTSLRLLRLTTLAALVERYEGIFALAKALRSCSGTKLPPVGLIAFSHSQQSLALVRTAMTEGKYDGKRSTYSLPVATAGRVMCKVSFLGNKKVPSGPFILIAGRV